MPVNAPKRPKSKEQVGKRLPGRFQQAWTFYEDMLNSNVSAGFLCVALCGKIKSFSVANLLFHIRQALQCCGPSRQVG